MSRSCLLGDGTRYVLTVSQLQVSFKPDGKSDATFEITEIKPTRGVKTVFKVCWNCPRAPRVRIFSCVCRPTRASCALSVTTCYLDAMRRLCVAGSGRTNATTTTNQQQHDTAVLRNWLIFPENLQSGLGTKARPCIWRSVLDGGTPSLLYAKRRGVSLILLERVICGLWPLDCFLFGASSCILKVTIGHRLRLGEMGNEGGGIPTRTGRVSAL